MFDFLGPLLDFILDLLWLRSSASDEQLGCVAQFIRLLLIVAIVAAIAAGIFWLSS